MNIETFNEYMKFKPDPPGNPDHIFILDKKQIAEHIMMSDQYPVLIQSEEGFFQDVQGFIDHIGSMMYSGNYLSDYIFVPACSRYKDNKDLERFFADNNLRYREGWRLFHKKDFLDRPGAAGLVKQILDGFISEYQLPKLPEISEDKKEEQSKDQISDEEIFSSVRKLNSFEEKPVEWLLYPYIPRGETVLLAAEGGTGKGFITASIVAGITTGKTPPFLGDGVPFDGDPETVLYLTTEDDVEKVLRGRHKNAGVNADNVLLISKKDEIIQQITYTDENEILKKIINRYKPSLVVFDPVQSFLPEHVRMGERHHMRTCMNHLNVLASECDTSFLVLCHTNKREGTTKARNQISDSSDLWDIARSVLMTGETGDGDIKFLSLEKANYTKPCDTVLYRIVDPGKAEFVGKTSKRFKDFVIEANETIRSAPKRAEATGFIIDTLKEAPDNSMPIKDLDEGAKAAGISQRTYRRAKEDLKKAGRIKMWQSGNNESKKWLVRLVNQEENNSGSDIHNLEL